MKKKEVSEVRLCDGVQLEVTQGKGMQRGFISGMALSW